MSNQTSALNHARVAGIVAITLLLFASRAQSDTSCRLERVTGMLGDQTATVPNLVCDEEQDPQELRDARLASCQLAGGDPEACAEAAGVAQHGDRLIRIFEDYRAGLSLESAKERHRLTDAEIEAWLERDRAREPRPDTPRRAVDLQALDLDAIAAELERARLVRRDPEAASRR